MNTLSKQLIDRKITCDFPIFMQNAITGRMRVKGCDATVKSRCKSCASEKKRGAEEVVAQGLKEQTADQALHITMTFKPEKSRRRRAEKNSLVGKLLERLNKRLTRQFGSQGFKYFRAIEITSSTNLVHVHMLLVLPQVVTAAAIARIRYHLRKVYIHSKPQRLGRKIRFGRCDVRRIMGANHLESMESYLVVDTDESLDNLTSNPDETYQMGAYIFSRRANGKHLLPPMKRRAHAGGAGFSGRRISRTRNWLRVMRLDTTPHFSHQASESDDVPDAWETTSPTKTEWEVVGMGWDSAAARANPQFRPLTT